MTFQQFIEAYNGKYIDFDGYYGAQCMDLMHQYCVEVLGITDAGVLAAPDARTVYQNYANIVGHDLFNKTDNTPTGVPTEGDIVFWGNDPNGHVAIFISGDANNFTSFDQNYPTGSPCHAQDHTYTDVLGWLTFKGQPAPDQALATCLAQHDQLVGELDQLKPQLTAAQQQISDMQHQLDGLNSQTKHYSDYEKQLAITLGIDIDEAKILGEITTLISQGDTLRQAQKDLQNCQTSLADETAKTADLQNKLQSATSSNSSLSSQLSEATQGLSKCQSDLKVCQDSQTSKPIFELFGFILIRR